MNLFDEGKPFYKANFHTHTTRSDGQRDPRAVIDLYRAAGYDILALTDHWKAGPEDGPEDGLLLLRGAEVDTMYPEQALHLVALGLPEGVDPQRARGLGPQGQIDWIRAQGGRAILAHPAWSLNTPEMIASLRDLTAVEVYNSVSGVPWNGDRPNSCVLLDIVANQHGPLIPFVASDDTHWYTGEQCMSFTRIQAEALTRQAVLDALDRGAFYASQGPEFKQITVEDGLVRVTCSPVFQVVFYTNTFWAPDRVCQGEGVTQADYRLNPRDHFARVELIDADGKRAWCSPIRL